MRRFKRSGDRTRFWRTALGVVIVLFAIATKVFFGGDDVLVIGLSVLGAGMVSPTYVTDLVRAWRSNSDNSAGGSSGITDGSNDK